jgi:hypothetical protein
MGRRLHESRAFLVVSLCATHGSFLIVASCKRKDEMDPSLAIALSAFIISYALLASERINRASWLRLPFLSS